MYRSTLALILIAMAALCALGCEDDAHSNEGKGSMFDTGAVDPPRDDERVGVPDDGKSDAEPDAEPPDPPDRGMDGGVDADPPADRGVDDSGAADEGAPPLDAERPCMPQATRPCGACADGFETCEEGTWGPCEPPIEVCNGRDDDCDGTADEGFDVGAPCISGLGYCAREGRVVCHEGAAACDGEPGPPEVESCNSVDDDCDGTVDEDFGGGQPCLLGLGECIAPGITACRQDRVYCDGEANEPVDERCNGLDDDCDGAADEDFDVGADCELGEGVCRRPGIAACTPGGGVACVGEVVEPGEELCNGLDDDCDGMSDEGFGGEPCSVGVGECARPGRMVCGPDGAPRCSAEAAEAVDERCNGLDDDCDGEVDEGLGLGAACTVGAGACERAGVSVCADDGSVRCPAVPGEASDETCDGVDEDCDGEVDEDFPVDAPCEISVGACFSGGRSACGDDGEVVCLAPPIVPSDEVCDGEDDDCDGAVDEGFGLGEACIGGAGVCARPGQIVCAADGTSTCGAVPGEEAFEVCNRLDDDCDGASDEGLGLGAACTVGVGGCQRPGALDCTADGAVACAGQPGQPADEICNAIDDDCDGEVDEDLTLDGVPVGGVCTPGLGLCRATGRVVCSVDGRPKCTAEPGQPADEVCNGQDDDCDGETDEGFGLGDQCAVGDGVCRRFGQRVCADGIGVCSVEPGLPSDERCNDLDDDCDGAVDEGIALDGIPLGGRCAVGQGLCLSGGEVICVDGGPVCDAQPGRPEPEQCDGRDHDCDGISDEGLGVGDACTVGVGACEQGGVLFCDDGGTACTARPGEARDERCDQTDDDCDGEIDEDFELGAACAVGLGACAREGVTVCGAAGLRTRCSAAPGQPVDEVCNAIDDDCDGRVDEGLGLGERCTLGLGDCRAQGERICADDGSVICDAQPGAPAPREVCDGRDDDCDGATDEGYRLGEACVSGLGICAVEGVRICVAGDGACDAEPEEPEDEVCDDLDNDCDGIVDEGDGDQSGVAFGICGPRYRSCLDVLRAGGVQSGVYRVSPEGAAGREVWCDQETDGGGWTLVLSSNAPPTDGLGDWHRDLLSTDPRNARSGVWAGLSHLGDRPFDVRFACRAGLVAAGRGYGVDLSFYGTPWYRQFIRGGEAVSCFAPPDGDAVLPARRDNLGRGVRAHGQPYPLAAGGRLVGERACEAAGDFLVDFDDGGLAGSGPGALDGTDWGSVDGQGVCGVPTNAGQWLVFVREAVEHPLGPMGIIGLPQLAEPIEAAGFEPVILDPDDPGTAAQLDPDVLPAVFFGRFAQDWPSLPATLRNQLGCYTLDGGSMVTEYDGFALLGTRLADDFLYLQGAPGTWGWLPAISGGGYARASDDPISVVDDIDPITRGLAPTFLAGDATERFISVTQSHPTIPVPMRALARFSGDGARFPAASYPALMRGRQCGASLLTGVFDYADAPLDPIVMRLVGNLAAAAASPSDASLEDFCGRGLGGRCNR